MRQPLSGRPLQPTNLTFSAVGVEPTADVAFYGTEQLWTALKPTKVSGKSTGLIQQPCDGAALVPVQRKWEVSPPSRVEGCGSNGVRRPPVARKLRRHGSKRRPPVAFARAPSARERLRTPCCRQAPPAQVRKPRPPLPQTCDSGKGRLAGEVWSWAQCRSSTRGHGPRRQGS